MGWDRRLRLTAGLFALTLATVSCVSSDPVVQPPSPGASVSGSGTAPGATPRGATTPATPGKTNPGGVPAPAYDDDGSVGAMARTYLRRAPASSLIVEFDWASGRDPGAAALDHLGAILNRELDKPAGITLSRGNQISSSRSTWSVADLAALERANRSRHSSGARATTWIGYVGGSFAPNPNALAVTYSASSVVIFRDRIDDASSALVPAAAIERAVLVHEIGHILALVNIGYRSRFDHEDEAHPNHSNNTASVMYWAVEDISVRNILRGGPPDDFDDADRADLAMLRGS